MAETRSTDPFTVDLSGTETRRRPAYRRLGLLNGLLIGLALGAGAWGYEMFRVTQLPVTSYMPSLWLAVGTIVLLCGFVGWLTARISLTIVSIVLWGLVAVASMLIMGYLPYYGRSFAVWLEDPRFWGRMVYPYVGDGTPSGLILGGLLIIMVLAVLALLQNYRLEAIVVETGGRGRMNSRGWLALLLPLPIVFLASLITQGVMANPSAAAMTITDHAVSVARDYEGDLRTLVRGDGISYAALAPVQHLLDGEYTLSIVDVNPLNATVIVGVDLSEGGWIYCRVINDQLSFCYDASPPYTEGLRSLITGVPPAKECRGCILPAAASSAAWLNDHRARFGPTPDISRVAQQGSHVLMRVSGNDGFAAECWVVGVSPMQLTECSEVRN